MLPQNCAAIYWALEQNVSSASASRLLIEIARRADGATCVATQVALGGACKLSERQTRTLLASLVADGFVKRTRRGGEGSGRAPDSYELVGFKQPENFAGAEQATGNECASNRQSSPPATGNPRRQQPADISGNDFRLEQPATLPPDPPKNIPPVVPQTSSVEGEGEGGAGGEVFKLSAEPVKRSRKAKPKRHATDATMPKAPTARMEADAEEAGLRNGSVRATFDEWRDWHISKATEIADHEASFRMWLRNGKKFAAKAASAKPGLKLAGIGPDGRRFYNRDHSKNTYR